MDESLSVIVKLGIPMKKTHVGGAILAVGAVIAFLAFGGYMDAPSDAELPYILLMCVAIPLIWAGAEINRTGRREGDASAPIESVQDVILVIKDAVKGQFGKENRGPILERFERFSLQATVTASADEVLAAADKACERATPLGTAFKREGLMTEPDGIVAEYVFRSFSRGPVLGVFHMTYAQSDDLGSPAKVQVSVIDCVVTQTDILGIIPIAPKTSPAIKPYRDFSTLLGAALSVPQVSNDRARGDAVKHGDLLATQPPPPPPPPLPAPTIMEQEGGGPVPVGFSLAPANTATPPMPPTPPPPPPPPPAPPSILG